MNYSERLARLREKMRETAVDAVVLGPSSHMVWLCGLSPHGDERPVLLVVTQQAAALLMPALNADSSRAVTNLPFYPWADADGPRDALVRLLEEAGVPGQGASLALDETMRADFALLVLGMLPGARHQFTDGTIGALRRQKDAAEYAILKANALVDDIAMQAGFAALRPGVTEKAVEAVIRDTFKAHGNALEFSSVCFGGNGAFPHHYSSDRALRESDCVLIDIGGRKDGYPSDMTRVATIGTPDPEFDKVHAVLEQAVTAALAAAKPGVPAKLVDKAARDVITAAGYGDKFLHRTGHGIGVDIHEPPYITATSELPLEVGNVFSIEPGIYLADRFGVRLEEIVILRENGPEVLSELPRAAFRVK
jgi:Xaa-Pro aminopeptidase